MILVGAGGSQEAFQAIMDGTNFVATVLIDPDEIGQAAMNQMASILAKREFTRTAVVPSTRISQSNAAYYYDPERSI